MKLSKSKYIVCLLFLWMAMLNVYGQTPDEQIIVKGTVVDQDKKPLPGVSISIQEDKKNKTVNTNANGEYTIEATSSDVLVYKMIGYGTIFKPAGEIKNGAVTLTKSLIDAGDDDVVYIPFGVRKKREVTATISTIS
ncbi:MAG: hypothetical protein EOP00_14755, partial [Pedobacter sp.]